MRKYLKHPTSGSQAKSLRPMSCVGVLRVYTSDEEWKVQISHLMRIEDCGTRLQLSGLRNMKYVCTFLWQGINQTFRFASDCGNSISSGQKIPRNCTFTIRLRSTFYMEAVFPHPSILPSTHPCVGNPLIVLAPGSSTTPPAAGGPTSELRSASVTTTHPLVRRNPC